ncbi:MAG: sulfatase [Verrucomicrobia bacterium]|nr:sulfatase [Verrucomicrobiota bacterium]
MKLRFLAGLALASLFALATTHAADTTRPNIVIIFADDLGYGDLGCYGHPNIRTPNLDRMAAEGMRFTEFYSAAEVCTPSRAALLTGRYPIRSGMCHDQFRVLRNVSMGHLPANEVTTAEALKARGYATGCIGKWHLGNWINNPAGHPRRHGFDFYFGLPHSNDMNVTPVAPKGAGKLAEQQADWWNAPLFRNEELIERPADQTTLTRRYTDEAVKFIQANKAKPFFLYLPHTFPHTPLFASKDFFGKSARGIYGDVVEELDASVGKVLDTLRQEKLAENTLVFFTSDNGPWLIMNQQGGSAGLLRDGKGSTWEGGMRVPVIAWWPGKIKAAQTQRTLACTMDLFTTSLKLAGADVPSDRPIDGLDIRPLLFGTGTVQREAYFFYRGTRLMAARSGDFKAHFLTQPGYGQPKPDEHATPLLFNLKVDASETFNVATNHPAVLSQIAQAVERHKSAMTPAQSQLVEAVPVPEKK